MAAEKPQKVTDDITAASLESRQEIEFYRLLSDASFSLLDRTVDLNIQDDKRYHLRPVDPQSRVQMFTEPFFTDELDDVPYRRWTLTLPLGPDHHQAFEWITTSDGEKPGAWGFDLPVQSPHDDFSGPTFNILSFGQRRHLQIQSGGSYDIHSKTMLERVGRYAKPDPTPFLLASKQFIGGSLTELSATAGGIIRTAYNR